MNYYKFYEDFEGNLVEKLKNLSFKEKFIFGLYCLKRNEYNYHFFSTNENFHNPFFLMETGDTIYNLANLNIKDNQLAESLLVELTKENSVPHSEDYDDAFLAIDACNIAFDLLKYYTTEEDKRLIRVSLTSIEVVEKWIYENFGYIEDNDEDFDKKILSYQAMTDEVNSQKFILSLLKKENGIVESMKKLDNIGISNIGIKKPIL